MKIRVSFLLPALLLFAAISLHATSLAPGCIANTLSVYEGINTDHECSVGILNFDLFTFASSITGTGNSVLLTDSQIELTPCNGVNSDLPGACLHDPTSLSGGFSISAVAGSAFSVGPGQTETYTIDWRFVIDNGPEDTGASLGLDPGSVNVTQTYCVDSNLDPTSPTPCTPQTISVDTTNPFNSVTFGTPALRFAEVQTVITLTGCTETGCSDGAGFDAVTGTGTIVDTPEPAAFLLVASGLLLLGALRKRAARV